MEIILKIHDDLNIFPGEADDIGSYEGAYGYQ
jgi:hypothetical protein